jgi:hypothetical protein
VAGSSFFLGSRIRLEPPLAFVPQFQQNASPAWSCTPQYAQ